MDPLCDYYLCTKDGESDLVVTFLSDDEALEGYDSVRKLDFWQAMQWATALWEMERAVEEDDDLRWMLTALFSRASGGAIGCSRTWGLPPTSG